MNEETKIEEAVVVPKKTYYKKLTPREKRAAMFYKQPSSKSFGNLYQSCVRAGYSPSYAKSIHNKGYRWLKAVRSDKLIEMAENAVEDIIAPTSKHIREKADLSKFVLSRLSKKYKEKIDTNLNGTITIQRMSFSDLPQILPGSEESRNDENKSTI